MTAESSKIQVEEDEEMVLEEEEEDHGAQSMNIDDGEEEKKHICHVCGKGFKSGKGLGGHKRIHKFDDDDDNEVTISSDDDDDSDDDDNNDPDYEYEYDKYDNDKNSKKRVRTRSFCINDLIPNGWCTKRKRSLRVHTSNLKKNSSSSSQDMMMDIESNNLMILAFAAEAVADKKKMKRLCKLKKQSPSFSSSSSTSTREHKLEDDVDEARDKHVCVTCNKSCTSYQSLGGHVTSHHRVKKLEAINDQVRAKFEHKEILLGLACTQKSTIAQTTAQTASTAARTEAPVEEVKIGQERMVLDFDLNKLPPEAEQEERV